MAYLIHDARRCEFEAHINYGNSKAAYYWKKYLFIKEIILSKYKVNLEDIYK